ncbi:MAG: hypothetical protein R6X10_09210, partial [Desulfobacterales bacterium]
GHKGASLNQLLQLLEKEGTEAIQTRVDEWSENDSRAEKVSNRQVIKTSSFVFAEVAFLNGFKIQSNTRGDSCPWCAQLNGKVIGRGQVMLEAGDWGAPGEKPMEVTRPHITAPYHKGCNCYLTHV